MILDFSSWWGGLSTIAQIYWIVAIPATLFFVIQLIMTFIGTDADLDSGGGVDAHFDADGGMGFHFMTLKNMIAFFAIFGWTGLALVDSGAGIFLVVFLSTFAGILMMVVMASLYYFMSKLQSSGTLKLENAIGQVGEVYISIPAKKGGSGQVTIKVQGSIRTLEAMTDELEDIKSGVLVEVEDIISDRYLLVRRNR